MCFEDQWDGIDATGRLVLVRRGGCHVVDKVVNAKKKGALGASASNSMFPYQMLT
jgi:aminopeptidase Y